VNSPAKTHSSDRSHTSTLRQTLQAASVLPVAAIGSPVPHTALARPVLLVAQPADLPPPKTPAAAAAVDAAHDVVHTAALRDHQLHQGAGALQKLAEVAQMARAQPGLAHAHVLGFGRGPSAPEGYHSINTSILSLSAGWRA